MTEHDHLDIELQDLLDERLGPAERAQVQAHVNACARCREAPDVMCPIRIGSFLFNRRTG